MSLVSWDVTCSLGAIRMYRRFRGNCCLSLLFPEDWGSIFLRNACTFLPISNSEFLLLSHCRRRNLNYSTMLENNCKFCRITAAITTTIIIIIIIIIAIVGFSLKVLRTRFPPFSVSYIHLCQATFCH
jgi:hypothetical protein